MTARSPNPPRRLFHAGRDGRARLQRRRRTGLMGNFVSQLKQRRVYRVAIGYAVAAWLMVQIAATVLPAFHAPELSDKQTGDLRTCAHSKS